MKSRKGIAIGLLVILAVVFQLMTPAAVLAQEETPPTEVPVTEEPVVEDPTQPEEPVYLPEVMEQAPEGTTLVVLNENGEAEPLATETALVIIEIGVAWWCPAGIQPGGDGCTPAQASLTDLITTIDVGEYAGNGTIYISNAYNGTGDGSLVVLDNNDELWYLEDLTVQGGWDTNAGAVNGTTTFNGQSLGINWYYELTINDLAFVDPIYAGLEVYTDVAPLTIDNVSVQGGEDTEVGIYVEGLGDINLNDVHVTGSYIGADLSTTPIADVTVTNSSFTEGEAGLLVATFPMILGPEAAAQEIIAEPSEIPWGTITLSNVVASNNDWVGAVLYAASNVNISNSVFSYNGTLAEEGGGVGLGIMMMLPGTVTLDHVDASNNNSVGAAVIDYTSVFPMAVGGTEAAEPTPLPLPMGMTVTVICSTFNNNSEIGFGVESMNPASMVNFIDSVASGNGLEDILVEGATFNEQTLGSCYTVPVPVLPYHYVQVSGGEPVYLDCVNYSGTILVLPNGDKAIYYCQATGTANAKSLAAGELPGALGSGQAYVSAMEIGLENGGPVEILPDGSIKVAFQIPQGTDPASLAILYWDPAQNNNAGAWVELPADALYDSLYTPSDGKMVLVGPHVGDAGRFEATVNFTGTFVLIQK